ncbi:hypothetical protein G7054_g12117 [Neopestalotiopsis clavispora]|nr:hypothetical protein G7054_g12117 [Neopestalotiopsis clavispora]
MPLPTISALARQTISCAFVELEKTITPGDARDFRSATLEQVKSEVLKIENELAARQSLRNMQRLAPLFQGLEHYAKVMDILCNGTPFLPWIWAPISLILRIASEHLEAFDLIIKGYSRIAECLGRFSLLSSSFKGNQDYQQNFSVFYADILEFHKHAYKFVRRRNWKLFFLTSWHRFQRRFDNIFENLQRHEALIDNEANAYNIAEAQQMRREIRAWREESDQKFEQYETEQSFRQFKSIVSWLRFDESDQLQTFNTLLEETIKYPGTCAWVLQNKKMASVLQTRPDVPLLWVQGAAGTGKSVLASSIVNFAHSAGSLVLSHFCNYVYPSSTKYESILRSLLLQLARKDTELADHIFKDYVEKKKAPSLPVLETLLRFLLNSISREPCKTAYVWIVIDGIDECEPLAQNKVLSLISQVTSRTSNSDEVFCKAIIFCRFSSSASAKLRKSQSLSLSEEKQHVSMSIRKYAAQKLHSIYHKFEQMSLTMDDIKEIEDAVTEKADGMFLYARLVLEYLGSNIFFSGEEIKTSVNELPAKLSEFKIITQILVRLDSRSVDRIKCALGWIAFSQRPLKKMEFLSAIAFSTGDVNVKNAAPQFMLDICAPLIEERPDSRLGFIHVSVKEFLQSPSSNLLLTRGDCLLQHGIATVTCLIAGTEAFANELAHETVLVGMIKGLHGFHIYSKEYWTEYLLSLIPPEKEPGSLSSTLFNMAYELAHRLSQLSTNADKNSHGETRIRDIAQQPTKFIDERIGLLHSPVLQTVINEYLKARSEDQLETELQGMEARGQSFDNIIVSSIPSPHDGVSIILEKYQATIRYILDQSDYPGVTATELESFRRHFRNCLYTCRVKGCIRATDGFERSEQCREHEMLHSHAMKNRERIGSNSQNSQTHLSSSTTSFDAPTTRSNTLFPPPNIFTNNHNNNHLINTAVQGLNQVPDLMPSTAETSWFDKHFTPRLARLGHNRESSLSSLNSNGDRNYSYQPPRPASPSSGPSPSSAPESSSAALPITETSSQDVPPLERLVRVISPPQIPLPSPAAQKAVVSPPQPAATQAAQDSSFDAMLGLPPTGGAATANIDGGELNFVNMEFTLVPPLSDGQSQNAPPGPMQEFNISAFTTQNAGMD